MLAEAMVIEEARVMPPAPPPGTTNDPTAIGGQPPGTYPTEQAKLEAALPKFQAAADAYPSSDAGITARYHARQEPRRRSAASTRRSRHYDQVLASGNALLARRRAARQGRSAVARRPVRSGHRHA